MSTPDQPALVVNGDVATLTFPTDDYALDFRQVSFGKYGGLYAEVTARHGETSLHTAGFDLLNQREQDLFHQRCVSVNSNGADWQSRLQSAIPGLRTFATAGSGAQGAQAPGAVWHQAMTAHDFLLQQEADVLAHVRDLVVPGCITVVSAPRASGKSLVALYLAVALGTGGVFRDERLTQRRVLLVDRDNPPSLVRRRLRWLGAHQVTALKILTRDVAPPLTDKATWAQFPVEDHDVVIMDSLGAATEGVSEKEGRQTQEFLATMKDLARRGPALLCLANTTKAGTNYRGRGEQADAVDILYEARNITGWTPDHAEDWWECLPDFGEHTWQQRATRRKGQAVLRVALIPTKFRLGIEPEPFVLEIDTRQEPWTLADVTEDVATAGERAAQESSRQERAKIAHAEQALIKAIAARMGEKPILKEEALTLLQGCGLTRQAARTLLESGGNHDMYPSGRWVIRQVPNHPHGKALGVYLAGKEDDGGGSSDGIKSPGKHKPESPPSTADGSALDGDSLSMVSTNENAAKNGTELPPQHDCGTATGDTPPDKQRCGSPEVGAAAAARTHFDPFTSERAVSPSDTLPQPEAGLCGSLVPNTLPGTTKPASNNGVSLSNDAVDAGSQLFAKVEKSREPESGRGNQNAPPIAVDGGVAGMGVCAPQDTHGGERSDGASSTSEIAPSESLPFADGSTLDGERSSTVFTSNHAALNGADLSPQPGNYTAKGDTPHDEQQYGDAERGGPFAALTHSSAPLADRSADTSGHDAARTQWNVCPLGGTHTWIRRSTDRLCVRCNATSPLPSDARDTP